MTIAESMSCPNLFSRNFCWVSVETSVLFFLVITVKLFSESCYYWIVLCWLCSDFLPDYFCVPFELFELLLWRITGMTMKRRKAEIKNAKLKFWSHNHALNPRLQYNTIFQSDPCNIFSISKHYSLDQYQCNISIWQYSVNKHFYIMNNYLNIKYFILKYML